MRTAVLFCRMGNEIFHVRFWFVNIMIFNSIIRDVYQPVLILKKVFLLDKILNLKQFNYLIISYDMYLYQHQQREKYMPEKAVLQGHVQLTNCYMVVYTNINRQVCPN